MKIRDAIDMLSDFSVFVISMFGSSFGEVPATYALNSPVRYFDFGAYAYLYITSLRVAVKRLRTESWLASVLDGG